MKYVIPLNTEIGFRQEVTVSDGGWRFLAFHVHGMEQGQVYNDSSRDQVMLLAMNDSNLDSSVNLQAAQRKEKRAELQLPPAKEGENILVFMAFHNPIEASSLKSLENVSNSMLIGKA